VGRRGSMVSGDGQVEQHISANRSAKYALAFLKAQMSQVMMSRWTSE